MSAIKNSKDRKIYLDILRIIAILLVIYNHTSEKGYFLYAFDAPLVLRIIYIMAGALVAVAVPIFFMISGTLLIPKEESIGDLYKKRVLRMVIVLVLFSVLQYAYQVVFDGVDLSVRYFLVHTITETIIPQYWYLYTYLAYLICLPLLRKMALNMKDKEYKYLFGAFLIMEGAIAAIVFLLNVGDMTSFLAVPFFNRVIVYPLLGYYMDNKVPEEKYNSKGVLKWIGLMIIVLVFVVAMTLYRDLPYEEFTTWDKGLFTTGFTLILDAGVFYIMKFLFKGRTVKKGLATFITAVGSTVFGIYLIENIIRDRTIFIYDFISGVLGKFLGAWLWCLIVLIIGAVIIYIVKLIPGVKKLL